MSGWDPPKLPPAGALQLRPARKPKYNRMLRHELAVAANAMADELLVKKRRSAADRQALVDDCVELLRRVRTMLDPKVKTPLIADDDAKFDPEKMVEQFMDWAKREEAAVRREVLLRAAEWVLGVEALQEHARGFFYEDAYGTHEALKAQLVRLNDARLDKLRRKREQAARADQRKR
jgi:hypothetical protein